MLKDRVEAGIRIAEELRKFKDEDCIILGIPRGGAIVAYHASKILNIPWDIIMPRKIGSPFNPEVAIGAVTQDGYCLINENIIKYYGISKEYIDREIKIQTNEIKRRMELYRGNYDFPDVTGKTVILIDDGIATGFTAVAAINSIKMHNAKKLITAVPVASVDAINMLSIHCDEVICIEVPENFLSVGSSYVNFEQNTDEQVIELFKQHGKLKFV